MASAREIVLKGLYKTETDGAYSNKALNDVLSDRSLAAADRAFATELMMGVIRCRLQLDYIIQKFSKLKLKKLSPWIHQILRMGVYQIICMNNVPDSAACNESVKLAAKYGHGAAKGYVNGVLRSIARGREDISYPSKNPERMSIIYSCPVWLTEKLVNQYGEETAEKILAESHKPHPVTLRVNSLKTTGEELTDILKNEGVSASLSAENRNCVYVDGALNINSSAAYKNGLYTLQNTSSMAAAEALDPKPGELVLDMCAAPGGKTTYIAELMQNRGRVRAFDIHPHKIELINSAAKRLGISIIEAEVNDASVLKTDLIGMADRVLADVPCSGIGVIHKKPDIKWRRTAEDIPELCRIQYKILCNAAEYVKTGGTLVYSTCTILKEENEEQTRRFLKEHTAYCLEEERTLQTFETGGSGFYIAKFIHA